MPLYYFSFRSGDVVHRDLDHHDLPTDTAAIEEAVHAARELVAQRIGRGEVIGDEGYDVFDQEGREIHFVSLRSVIRLEDPT